MESRVSLVSRLIVIAVVFTLVLCGMIAKKQWTLNTGIPVVLETQPIDPRSLFRGDYVRLNYTISTLGLDQHPELVELKRGDELYVVLAKGDPYWQPQAIHTEHPGGGDVVLKGRVDRVVQRFNRETRKFEEAKDLQVKYGIESYFVPEGEGRAIERPAEGEKVSIEVAVDSFGNAGIRAVLVNGQPRYIESLF